jgi:hypothetical protein
VAETRGIVQRLKITSGSTLAWAYIGPSPTNTRLLLISQAAANDPAGIAFRASMAEALSGALVARREVIATHGDNDSTITQLQIEPG